VLGKAAQQQYSKQDVRRMLAISEQQLRGWQRQGFISAADTFSFSDLIALRALQKLRENRVPSKRIGRALVSLKQKLSDVASPLSELKIISNGRSIAVHIAGQKMEAITGQMLFDFDTAELSAVRAFPQSAKSNRSVKTDEKQAELWFQRGLDLEESGAPPLESIEAYKKAVELNPSAAGALVNLGTIHYHMHKFKEAADYYQKAIDVDPRYSLAHFNLGNLCDEQGQYEKALEHYGTALKLNPDYADAHYNVALLCEQMGDFLKATKHWKAYLKVDGSSSWASIARRQLEKLRQITVVGKS
jgi:tetratricopeptide (TPR) repeat protein